MATLFEAWLVGDDDEHLQAVGEAALDEIERLEQLLSRFDPAAELSRLNREAGSGPVQVSRPMWDVLSDVLRANDETDGFFDACAPVRAADRGSDEMRFGKHRSRRTADLVLLDAERRTVQFAGPEVRLDLGGFGKGFALDVAVQAIERFGVGSFLLHGGTSSIVARGTRPDGGPWSVTICNPFFGEDAPETVIELHGTGLSTSVSKETGTTAAESAAVSDLVDPHNDRPVIEPIACTVTAATATEAEILSTALAAMGRRRGDDYLRRQAASSASRVAVYWREPVASPLIESA